MEKPKKKKGKTASKIVKIAEETFNKNQQDELNKEKEQIKTNQDGENFTGI